MATFTEWATDHGKASARRQFGLSDHLVLVNHPRHVEAVCGKWRGTQPIRDGNRGTAKQVLRDAIDNAFETEEELWPGE